MVAVTDLLFTVAAVAGGGCLWLGYLSYRQDGEPGSTAFGLFLATWGIVPTAMSVAGGLNEALFAVTQLFLWCLATLAYFLFALQYTGSYTQIRPLTITALAAPALVIFPWQFGPLAAGEAPLLAATVSLVFAYYTALALIGGALVVRVAFNYGHLSVRDGVVVALCGLVPMTTNTIFGVVIDETGPTLLSASLFAAGFLATLLVSAVALLWVGMFETTIAAGTIGERAIARETDDPIIITDDDERVLKCNEAARSELDPGTDPLGDRLPAIVETDIETLVSRDAVELSTDGGVRTFDPRVTALTDQHGRQLGSMVSLRDITDREIRRQRLEVLNRIMRHNLRNQVSVIEAHTEVVADELADDDLRAHLETAMESTDSLAALGVKVKRIEDLLGSDREPSAISLPEFAEGTVAEITDGWPTATITLEPVPEVTILADRAAVTFAVETVVETVLAGTDREEPVVDLAITAADTADRYHLQIRVESATTALSQQDIDVIRDGGETALKHGSGVSLWVANWAVADLGGELAFQQRESGGTVVRIALPAESVEDTPV
ncbi:MAG: PAS domain-containing protein [Halovenus sp.]